MTHKIRIGMESGDVLIFECEEFEIKYTREDASIKEWTATGLNPKYYPLHIDPSKIQSVIAINSGAK